MLQNICRVEACLSLRCANKNRKKSNLRCCNSKTRNANQTVWHASIFFNAYTCPRIRILPSKNHMIWLTGCDESRAIRDVKRGQVSPSRNTCTFQTVFDSHF